MPLIGFRTPCSLLLGYSVSGVYIITPDTAQNLTIRKDYAYAYNSIQSITRRRGKGDLSIRIQLYKIGFFCLKA